MKFKESTSNQSVSFSLNQKLVISIITMPLNLSVNHRRESLKMCINILETLTNRKTSRTLPTLVDPSTAAQSSMTVTSLDLKTRNLSTPDHHLSDLVKMTSFNPLHSTTRQEQTTT